MSTLTYLAFSQALASRRLPAEALRLCRRLACARCGVAALAHAATYDLALRAAAAAGGNVLVLCEQCIHTATFDAVAVMPTDPELQRVIDRARAEVN